MVLNWGIASAGKISHDFCTAVRSLFPDDHKFVAVAARSLESAKKFADVHGIAKAYGSYEELGKDANVEAVYIGAINTAHFDIAKSLIEAGKHLLIEKPLTINAKLSLELTKLAKAKKVFLMEAIWSRFLPAYQFALKEIKSGAIGDVLHVQCGFGTAMEFEERIVRPDLGGGTILDLGVYTINGTLFLGYPGLKPEKIVASGLLSTTGVDTSMNAILTFPNRKTAVISTDCRAAHPNTLNIIGSKGILTMESPFWCTEKVTINGVTREFKFKEGILSYNYTNSAGLAYEADEVRKCVAAGKLESDVLPHADSLLIAEIEDELRRQIGVKYPQED